MFAHVGCSDRNADAVFETSREQPVSSGWLHITQCQWPFLLEVDWKQCGEFLAELLLFMTYDGAYRKH
jgi:hypothetical protein